jgi:spermidine synthase
MNFGYRSQRYTESAIDWARRDELIVPYTRYMSLATAYLDRPVQRLALVGLGGGRTISYLLASMLDASADVAELDPAVITLARKYFGTESNSRLKIYPQDGRLFLNQPRNKYDVILLDAYRGPFVPFHLTTKEFYQTVKSRLAPGGVVAQNVEPTTMFFDSALKTMQAVFDQVDVFDAGGNIVLIGYAGAKLGQPELLQKAQAQQARYRFRYNLAELARARAMPNVDASAKVLTDDFAPVENLKTIRRHNEKRQ